MACSQLNNDQNHAGGESTKVALITGITGQVNKIFDFSFSN